MSAAPSSFLARFFHWLTIGDLGFYRVKTCRYDFIDRRKLEAMSWNDPLSNDSLAKMPSPKHRAEGHLPKGTQSVILAKELKIECSK